MDFGREKGVFPLVLIQVKSAAKRTVFGLKNKREKTFLPFKTQLFHIQFVRYAASGKFREIPSDFELLEIPHFAPVLIEKTKQNKTTISNNLKNSMMSFRDLLKSGTNPTLQSN